MLWATKVLLFVMAAASVEACSRSSPPTELPSQRVLRDSVEWIDSDAVVTRAVIWSPIEPGDDALPTLVFSPGFYAVPSDYSILLSRWASEGYLVIGIAHPPFTNPDEMELYDASNLIAQHLVRALDHVLRDRGRAGSPFARVDPDRIGLVGHSVGGSAAAQACAWDSRVRAAMDLDGTIFGDVVHTGMRQPFFLLRKRVEVNPDDPPQFFEHRDQGNLHEDYVLERTKTMYWLTVDSLDHMAFTDAALEPSSARNGGTGAANTQELTTSYVLDFFGHYLSGAPRSERLDRSPFAETELRIKR